MSPGRASASLPTPGVETTGCTFDRETHSYTADGVQLPSVTQVLNDIKFVDFSHVPDDVLLAAQRRGSYVHQVLHYWLEDDYDLADVDERFRGYVDSAIAYFTQAQLRPLCHPITNAPLAVEYRFWDRAWGYAGTMDYVAWDPDGVLAVNDFKTGLPSDAAAPVQLAAYERGLRLTLFPDHRFPIRRRALKLHRDGKPATVTPYGDAARDLGMFHNALTWLKARYRNDALLETCADQAFLVALRVLQDAGIERHEALAGLSCLHFRRNHLRHVA